MPIASGVQIVTGEPRGVFSASDNGMLVYQEGGEAANTLAWFTAEGARKAPIAEVGAARTVFLSPHQLYTLVSTAEAGARADFWRVHLTTGARNRLTFVDAAYEQSTFAAWAPDSRGIAFGVRRGGAISIPSIPADGGVEQPIFFSYDVAKDGRILALQTSERRALRPLTLVPHWTATLR